MTRTISRDRPRRLISAALLACTAGLALGTQDVRGAEPARPAKPTVRVTTAPLAREELKDRLKGFGTVSVGQQSLSDVSFQHGGQVVRLDAQPGQKVDVGQPLATITTDPAASLSYRNAVATEAFARRDYDRARELLAQHLATNAQVAVARKALADATAALENERALGNDKATDTAKAATAGFVSSVSVSVGDRIPAGAVVLKLSRMDGTQRVTMGVQPDLVARVRPGQVALVTPVYGDQSASLRGAVVGTSATVDPVTHLVDVWIDVAGPPTALSVGSGVTVSVILSEHVGWTVPRDAVLRDAKGGYVFTVQDGVAHRVDVNVGLQSDRTTELLDVADPAMRVVTSGNYELRDGAAVTEADPKKASASGGGGQP